MIRVVLDTNIIVSAALVREGTQAVILLLALRGDVAPYLSESVFAEYDEVLRRPRFKLGSREMGTILAGIRRVGRFVHPSVTVAVSGHESDNRFLECAEAAEAHYLVTGNTRHFPPMHKGTRIVTGRQFLDLLAAQQEERN